MAYCVPLALKITLPISIRMGVYHAKLTVAIPLMEDNSGNSAEPHAWNAARPPEGR